ncbi:MAG: 50S ribosomal protein L10 [Verrucomicrobia bacterium]|nr:50S ribosomal protein L10 [Verrucomicrobiota bacterium]
MKKEKQFLLDEIKEQLQRSPSFLIAQYSSFGANRANEFRRALRKIGVDIEIVRKRMFFKAAEELGIPLSVDCQGHIGIIFAGNEPVEVTQSVLDYSKGNDSCFELLGGRVEGHVITASDVKRLSQLPNKNTMRAQFLGLLEAPMAQTLATMEALLTSVAYCLENKAQGEQQ